MTIGKFGRRPPKQAPALMLGPLLTGAEITHPASVDYGSAIEDWQMLGNDQYGDCVSVAIANDRHAVTSVLTDNPTYATLEQVLAFYKTQNPGFPAQDQGMEIQTALETLVKDGGPDGVKAVAFAKVDHTNLTELDEAIAIFGGLIYGIVVTDANEREFNAGEEWDDDIGATQLGGHGIYGIGYHRVDSYKFVTWAQETSFSEDFARGLLEEAWVVLWPETFGSRSFLAGVDQAALVADFKTLTGQTLVPPTPAPSTETPEQKLERVASAWLARSPRTHKQLQQALRDWLDSLA